MTVTWEEWGEPAFVRARDQNRLVLARLRRPGERPWAVPTRVADRFVLVQVFADERPDLAALFSSGSAAVLGAEGSVLLASTEIDEAALARLAASGQPAGSAVQDDGPAWTGAVGGGSRRALDPRAPRRALDVMKASSSWEPDFAAYAACEWGDAQASQALLAAALAPLAGGSLAALCERADLCGAASSLPEGGGACARAAVEAAQLAVERFFDRAAGVFFIAGSRQPRLVCADANARAALALLRVSALPEGRSLRDVAESVLRALRHGMYDPLLGMIHARVPGQAMVYGLLADNAWTMLAFTEAYLCSGHKPYREFADALCRFLFQEFWEREHGGFLHRIAQRGDPLGAARPRLPKAENAVAFEGVWRLSEIKGTANYRKWVELGLTSPAFGEPSPAFARVQDLAARGRMDLELVGRMDDLRTEQLLAAVNRAALPRKIVSFVDPDDQDYIQAHRLEAPSYPRLFGCVDLRPVAEAAGPAGVPSLIKALRRAEASAANETVNPAP